MPAQAGRSGEQREDRRRARTREALLCAGQALFAARPVDAVSIDEIVAAAEVAKGSFYNHFADKDDLARAVAARVRGDVEDLAGHVNRAAADPAARVARALCAFARQAVDQPERVAAGLRLFPAAATPDAPMNRGVRADIQAGLASGRFDGVTLEVGVLLAVGAVQIAVLRALESGRAGAPAVARGLAFGLLRGLGVAAGEARDLAARAGADIFETGPAPEDPRP